jgi:dynactin complex subunit
MCENEIVKCDYEKQLKQKDSKIAYLNDSVTSLETLVSEKSIEIKTLKEELDSYEIISESSEDIMKDEGDDESDDEGDDEAEPFICNTRCIILNIVILYVYLYTIYLFNNVSL